MSKVVATLKFTGVISLGLLTGIHLNFSTSTLSSILTLASAPQAQRAFSVSLGLLRQVTRPLEVAASGVLVAAWWFAGKGGRHPYLLLTAAVPLVARLVEGARLSAVEAEVVSVETEGRGRGGVEVNGEVVRGGLERWRRWGLVRGGLLGMGFAMGVVGIWGDGA
ncbi:hypothetical protein P167DRAFT_479492 [Morchella conica CCBAS932]|uniref:DUF1772-domain-containing protein n=1 Tax=Morchella conica CCBAS932 TaxID=1392247 RepID=A0A3N4L2P3_9PEZI|nr:hypothetical protein P167DRAFT_479492 [Morchella conica CCBAS932]